MCDALLCLKQDIVRQLHHVSHNLIQDTTKHVMYIQCKGMTSSEYQAIFAGYPEWDIALFIMS